MLRTLFLEFPEDQTSWFIEDQYMLGSDLLVAPLMEEGNSRKVYLPPGSWIDYQTGKVYSGAQWQQIAAGEIPVILLVKNHAVIPQVKVAQNTGEIDWNDVELRVFSTDNAPVSGLFALPQGNLQTLKLEGSPQGFTLKDDPLKGKVKWQIKRAETR
jgi:alpha-D-xyloside xylohydrolase